MLKLWIAFILTNLALSNYLISRRYKLLSHQEIEDANVAFAIVNQQKLPID